MLKLPSFGTNHTRKVQLGSHDIVCYTQHNRIMFLTVSQILKKTFSSSTKVTLNRLHHDIKMSQEVHAMQAFHEVSAL